MAKLQVDSNDNPFVDLGEWFRITLVRHESRKEEKDWAGQDVLRIQKYVNQKNSQLAPGPEIPMHTREQFADFLIAVSKLVTERDSERKVKIEIK